MQGKLFPHPHDSYPMVARIHDSGWGEAGTGAMRKGKSSAEYNTTDEKM